jgi:hypothetical protein
MRLAMVVAGVAFWAAPALAQQQACSSPAFESRLVAAVAKGEVAIKAIPAGKAEAFARCYARTACASLNKIEFEMYALSAISGYGDDRAEKEYLGRMKTQRKENNAALDKLTPKALTDGCKREVGVP